MTETLSSSIRVIHPRDLIFLQQPAGFNVTHVNYHFSKSYCEYSTKSFRAIRSILSRSHNASALKFMNEICSDKPLSIRITGLGDIYKYNWPSGEYKILPVIDGMLITSDLDWLDYYPFIKILRRPTHILNEIQSYSVQFIDDFFKPISSHFFDTLGENILFLTLSHNGHYGHFLLDDFPSIIGNSLDLQRSSSTLIQFGRCSPGIKDILLSNSANWKSRLDFDVCRVIDNQSCVLRSVEQSHSFITNHLLKSYILGKVFMRISLVSMHKSSIRPIPNGGKLIFFTRSGDYSSRILNYEEIESTLLSFGFTKLNPSDYSTIELLALSRNAVVIVAESGSCSVCAQLYSPANCKVISLIPERFFLNPSDQMIRGGLPYHLIMPSKMNFLLGQTAKEHPIQTSDIVRYNPVGLTNTLNDVIGDYNRSSAKNVVATC